MKKNKTTQAISIIANNGGLDLSRIRRNYMADSQYSLANKNCRFKGSYGEYLKDAIKTMLPKELERVASRVASYYLGV
jgi:hypothetical protein